jgi:hydroxymethylbilane synthase
MNVIRIGTRGSLLALAQTEWVRKKIEAQYANVKVESIVIKTTGDRFLTDAVKNLGGKGVFVKEIEEGLLRKAIDVAVHSLKDIPTEIAPGLTLAAIPEREDPRDAFVSPDGAPLTALRSGARIGTGSLRRRAQILHYRRDLKIVAMRGNIDTRLKKLDHGEVDGLIVAVAGLKRIGKADRISEFLAPEICLGAVAQGALCLEARASDPVLEMISFLHDVGTAAEVTAERAFLRRLEGGCHLPVGARAYSSGVGLRLLGVVAAADGSRLIRGEASGPAQEGETLGVHLAEDLLRQGGSEILSQPLRP